MFDWYTVYLYLTIAVPGSFSLFIDNIHDSPYCWSIKIPNILSDSGATIENTRRTYFVTLSFLYPLKRCPTFDQKQNEIFS